jgi:hypothetical protein
MEQKTAGSHFIAHRLPPAAALSIIKASAAVWPMPLQKFGSYVRKFQFTWHWPVWKENFIQLLVSITRFINSFSHKDRGLNNAMLELLRRQHGVRVMMAVGDSNSTGG